MSQTVVTVDVGGTGANNANAALTNLGALPTFGGSITGNLNVSNNIVVTGNANLGNYVVSGNSISTTENNGDVTLVPKGTGKLRVRSKGLFGNGAEAHFSSSGIDESSIAIGSVMDSNGAAEILAVNKNSGTLAYSEFIAINDSGDQDQGWISIGVNSSGYDDPDYTLTGPDDGYVLFEAPQGTSANGDLILGTGSYGLNNKIILAAGGFAPSDAQLIVAPADLKRANLSSYSVAANVVTFVTDVSHTFSANDIVAISDVGATYDGTRTITAVTSNTFNVSVTTANIGSVNLSPPGFAIQFLPFNKGTVELTAQLFVGENSKSTIENADITLAVGHAIPLGIVVDNDGPGQTVMFNKSNGTLSYSEYIAHNDAGNVEHGWISVGINSSGYDDPEFPITKADDGYLLFEAPEGTTGDGDLIIGTGAFGAKNRLIFAAEGFDEANAQMIITPNESVRISIPTDASSSNTGALQVVGGVGVQGSLYVQGNQTIQGDLIVNGSQVIQSIDELTASGPISLVSDGNIANTWDQGIVGTYAVSKTSNTQSISFKSIANNTATLTTTNNHIFLVEDYVVVANVDATFDGTHRITAVTSNTFSYFKLANNLTQTAATGTGTVDKAARYTGVVKRASDGAWRVFSNLGTRPGFNTDFADANLVYDSIIAGEGTFNGSLKLGSPNTATISYSDANNRTFTIPAVGGNRTFAFIDQAQTFTAAQAFNSTVSATKFIPTAGDATGNGLYLSGTNKLGLSADGVERVSIAAAETVVNDGSADYDFRVESDGNANMLLVDGGLNRVGIGTGSPEQTLHVQGDGYVSGNVGIGTTNPSHKLYVEGSSVLFKNSTSNVNHYMGNSSYGWRLTYLTGDFSWFTNGADRLTLTNNGAVGIGITNPSEKLHVVGNIKATDNDRFNFITQRIPIEGAPQNGTYKGYILLAKAYTSGQVNASYVIGRIVTRRGNSSTGHNIDVYDVVSSTGYQGETFTLQHVSAGTDGGGRFERLVKCTYGGTVYHAIESMNDGGVPSTEMTFIGIMVDSPLKMTDGSYVSSISAFGNLHTSMNFNGNIGIGTTNPGQLLDVVAANSSNAWVRILGGTGTTLGGVILGNNDASKEYGRLQWNNLSNDLVLSHEYTSGNLIFRTNSTEKVRIDVGGRVLVGTTQVSTSSSEKFEVYGGMSLLDHNSDTVASVYIKNRSTTAATIQPYTYFADSSGNRAGFGIKTSDSTFHQFSQGGITIYTGAAGFSNPRVVVDSTGNVGIGTTSAGFKLEVVGTARINNVRIPEDLPAYTFLLMGA